MPITLDFLGKNQNRKKNIKKKDLRVKRSMREKKRKKISKDVIYKSVYVGQISNLGIKLSDPTG